MAVVPVARDRDVALGHGAAAIRGSLLWRFFALGGRMSTTGAGATDGMGDERRRLIAVLERSVGILVVDAVFLVAAPVLAIILGVRLRRSSHDPSWRHPALPATDGSDR
jgi:hypothetical protein